MRFVVVVLVLLFSLSGQVYGQDNGLLEEGVSFYVRAEGFEGIYWINTQNRSQALLLDFSTIPFDTGSERFISPNPQLSPDGTLLAFTYISSVAPQAGTITNTSGNVLLFEIENENLRQITFDADRDNGIEYFVEYWNSDSNNLLLRMTTRGSDDVLIEYDRQLDEFRELLILDDDIIAEFDRNIPEIRAIGWSPDSKQLLFSVVGAVPNQPENENLGGTIVDLQIFAIDLNSGYVANVARNNVGFSASWDDEMANLYYWCESDNKRGLCRTSTTLVGPEMMVTTDTLGSSGGFGQIAVAPNSNTIAFTFADHIYVYLVETAELTEYSLEIENIDYISSLHWIYPLQDKIHGVREFKIADKNASLSMFGFAY